jgi:hypothetical protein
MEFLEDKKELIFLGIGAVIFTTLLIAAIFSLRFLAREVNKATNSNLIKTPEAVRFNLEKISEFSQ